MSKHLAKRMNRTIAKTAWLKNNPFVTDTEAHIFNVGFNMGWAARSRPVLPSPARRFHGPVPKEAIPKPAPSLGEDEEE